MSTNNNRRVDTSNLEVSEDDRNLAIAFMESQREPYGDYDYATPFMEAARAYYLAFRTYPALEDMPYGWQMIAVEALNLHQYDRFDCYGDDERRQLQEEAIAEIRRMDSAAFCDRNDEDWPNARAWINEMLPDQPFTERWGDTLLDSFTFDDPTSQTLWEIYARGVPNP